MVGEEALMVVVEGGGAPSVVGVVEPAVVVGGACMTVRSDGARRDARGRSKIVMVKWCG